LDKQILNQYIDACKVVDETKEEIRKLKKNRKRILADTVKGSSYDFPYTLKTYRTEGLAYSVLKDPDELDRLEVVLKERLQNAERIKHQVEMWLNTIPMRMQRIIRYKIFEGLTWAEVATRMGRKATPDGIRKEYENFMKMA
jgi:DNA-directed RNA polymerase specialized sigma24 family protein